MSEMEIKGRSVYYEVHGQGEPVILLHHGFGCTKMWVDVIDALTKAGYMAVVYDRRGYGRSEPGEDFWEFYVSDGFRAESVDELGWLTNGLGMQSFHLLGQCEGGAIALQFAARYPNRVKSVTTSSTMCFSEITLEAFNAKKFPKGFSEMNPELQAKMKDWHGEDRTERFYEQFRTYGGAYGRDFFDLRPILDLVKCPALVMYPDRSFMFEVEQAVAMYRGLPKGQLAVLPSCGHNTYEHQPEEYCHFLVRFLNQVTAEEEDGYDVTKTCFG
jgi:pimeloyl-ACP methyl ester carboxylesterase